MILRLQLLVFALFVTVVEPTPRAPEFRVMTFNIWLSGRSVNYGLEKIAKHIAIVNPDIVCLQEVEEPNIVKNLTDLLGGSWKGIAHLKTSYPDTAILTKHTLMEDHYGVTTSSVGVRVILSNGEFVNVWNLHLDYLSYGPYAAQNKMVTNIEQIMAGEDSSLSGVNAPRPGRVQNMEEIRKNLRFKRWLEKTKTMPLILTGDFNSPSHLDWTDRQARFHGGWAVRWPTSVIAEQMGLIDSYRQLHPDINLTPGHTWSTVNKFNPEWDYSIPEPQDRVDFIYYKGPIDAIQSWTYAGNEPLKRIPYHRVRGGDTIRDNDYPSDHFAVITDFRFK